MHIGMFMEFEYRSPRAAAAAFREGFDLVDAAESWGLDSVWLSEFHFMPDRSVLSSPVVTAGAIAARTKRMRIGTAVYVLPLTHPLRIAEEIATLDQISGGRLDFGVGRSGFMRSYQAYGIDYATSQARFDEAMHVIREAWKGEPFTHIGEHYQVHNAHVTPEPLQQPHPPLRMAATSTATFEKVAKEGLPLFVGLRGDGLTSLKANIASYRQAWQANGHPGLGSVYLRVPVYAAQTHKAALDEPRENIVHYFKRQARLMASQSGKRGPGEEAKLQSIIAGLDALAYEDILETRVAFGCASAITERLMLWRDEVGIDGVVMEINAGGQLSEEQVRNSVRLVTHDVMPALR